MTFRRAAKVDSNQSEIVKALRDAGAIVKIVSQVKHLFDIIAFYNGSTFCIEIKDGNKPKSARKLTDGELKCKQEIESVGCNYYIIESVEQALKLIGYGKI